MNNYLQKKCPTINSKETGQNIKRIMKARGLNVKDVQEYLKLACPQSIYHWFEGKSVPNIDNIYALSQLFNVSMDSIVCGDWEYKDNPLPDLMCERLNAYIERFTHDYFTVSVKSEDIFRR